MNYRSGQNINFTALLLSFLFHVVFFTIILNLKCNREVEDTRSTVELNLVSIPPAPYENDLSGKSADDYAARNVPSDDNVRAFPRAPSTNSRDITPSPTNIKTSGSAGDVLSESAQESSTAKSGNPTDKYEELVRKASGGNKGDEAPAYYGYSKGEGETSAGKKHKGRGGVYHTLKDRNLLHIPIKTPRVAENAIVAISVKVDENGHVVEASVEPSYTTTSNVELINEAIRMAKEARFSESANRGTQSGIIYFRFEVK